MSGNHGTLNRQHDPHHLGVFYECIYYFIQGDSGGPMLLSQNGIDVVVGLVSYGTGCGGKVS